MAPSYTPPDTAEEIRDVNVRYHDAAADHYDAKWGVQFNEVGRAQVVGKLAKLLGRDFGPYERSLELGAGTGYFSINLLLDGRVRSAVATDISPGMTAAASRNAAAAGVSASLDVQVVDAEALPFDDASFDLVLGHAVLHHIPDLDAMWREVRRVLRPGGVAVFAGEPSAQGDRIAQYPKRAAVRAAPLWRRIVRARALPSPRPAATSHEQADGEALESFVDVHAFTPATLSAPAAAAGFEDVRVRGEELLANWFGWTNRTLEASADPATIPWLWIQYAFRGYLALQKVDRALLEPRLPPAIFYNLMIAARRP